MLGHRGTLGGGRIPATPPPPYRPLLPPLSNTALLPHPPPPNRPLKKCPSLAACCQAPVDRPPPVGHGPVCVRSVATAGDGSYVLSFPKGNGTCRGMPFRMIGHFCRAQCPGRLLRRGVRVCCVTRKSTRLYLFCVEEPPTPLFC